jgi:ribosome modulation factor
MNPNSKGYPAELIYDNYNDALITMSEAVEQFIVLLAGEDAPALPRTPNGRLRAFLDVARNKGQVAHHHGKPPEACPYYPNEDREAWFEGYYHERLNASVGEL